jgi:ABC-type antimicrobial peptide transport system permease subunit
MQVPAYEVVGVVKDAKYLDLREKTEPIMYFPLAQYEYPGPECAILMRSEDPLAGVTASVKTVLHEINPAIEVDFRVLKTQIHQTLLQDKLMAALSSFFGLLSALLAAIGLYGVISYLVTGRTNEIGIRVALGAQRCDVLRMVLREAGVVTVAGLLLGAGLALAAAQAARSLLFELKPSDPVTFVFAILSLSVVALLAGFLPAHRASRVDPMIALRYE